MGDPLDLFPVHQIVGAPPALEFEKTRRLRFDIGEHVIVLVPPRVRGVQILEVADEVGAIELAVAEIRSQ